MRPTDIDQLAVKSIEQAKMVEQQADQAQVNELVFEDENHHCKVLKSLNMMRKNRHFCDVVLNVGNHEIPAHRAVLASASPYLFELFTADDENAGKGNKRENVITYKLNGGFEKNAFERLVNYAYTSRLEVPHHQVKSVYLAASFLKMDQVIEECSKYLIEHLNINNCLDIRSLPGLSKHKGFLDQVEKFIAKEIEAVSKSNILLSLPCIKVEVLNQTREEMSLIKGDSLCQLVLDWIKRQWEEEELNMDGLTEKMHLLYLAMDNSLQDCAELPSGDVSETDIVQDYKKMSKRHLQSNPKGRRKGSVQPAKPRVLIYSREAFDTVEGQHIGWNLIAASQVGDHSFLAIVTINGTLTTMSVMLRLNQPSTPSPISTPVTSRPSSMEKPDTYCLLPNMSSVKCAVGCANLNDKLLVCGGYDRGECLRTVECYDPSDNTWTTLTSMKEARGRFDIAVVKGQVFAIGGSNGTTELSTVEVFDPESKKWSRVTSLPLPRSNTGVCSLNEKVYCIGGWNGQVGIKQCDVYDPETQEWTSVASLNVGRYQAGVCAVNGCVFAVGGCDAWNCLNSVEVFDPQSNTWTYGKGMITARRGCGVAVFKGKLYVVGGSDGTHSLCSTEIYDLQQKTWTPGPNMTTSRANVGVCVIGDRLYAVGGFSGKAFLNSIEYLDEKTDEWTTFVPKLPTEQQNGHETNGKEDCLHRLIFPIEEIESISERNDNQ